MKSEIINKRYDELKQIFIKLTTLNEECGDLFIKFPYKPKDKPVEKDYYNEAVY